MYRIHKISMLEDYPSLEIHKQLLDPEESTRNILETRKDRMPPSPFGMGHPTNSEQSSISSDRRYIALEVDDAGGYLARGRYRRYTNG